MNHNFKDVMEVIKTPNKFGKLVLSPSGRKGTFDSHAVDCPFVFEYSGKFYMTYIGWDGIGYRTGLACSSDLIHWEKTNKILIDVGEKGSIDAIHAHKPGIIWNNGKLYHFYCAVSPNPDRYIGEIENEEIRGITFAFS